ncbi:hypothetical protein [Microbulbifer aestuariivivens]|uniref:hypothetical protein n=1 Tax=Microbulbifer aestuariivivens TaxID=1908308 RepID=UPI0031E657A5
MPEPEGERTVYLIPEYDDDLQAMEILSSCFDVIFEAELNGWHTDENAWPKNRTFKMFRDWFSLEFHSMVTDLCGYEFEDDGYV